MVALCVQLPTFGSIIIDSKSLVLELIMLICGRRGGSIYFYGVFEVECAPAVGSELLWYV